MNGKKKKWWIVFAILAALFAWYIAHKQAERRYICREEERLKRKMAVRRRREAIQRLLKWKAAKDAPPSESGIAF